jgi:hypothetical protein
MHDGASQKNRRTMSRSSTFLPVQGKSAVVLTYRLWTRRDDAPHNGQDRSTASECAETTIASCAASMWSTIKLAGIKVDTRKLPAMVLIPFRKLHQANNKLHRD